MDLLSATPTSIAKFEFKDAAGEPIKTDKGKPMFVSIYGTHSKEYQGALLEKHRRTIAILEKHKLSGDDKITEAAKADIKESDEKLLCDITSSILLQIDGKDSRSVKDFYSNADFAPWFVEIANFANNKANFIKA